MSSSAAAGFINGTMVTIKNRYVSGKDEYGNDVYSFTTSQVGGCSVQQSGSREDIGFNDQVITGIVVYMPYGTDITYLDSMTIDGVEYEANAEPQSWKSPFTGSIAPVMVRGTIAKGASS